MSELERLLFLVFDVLRRKQVPIGVPEYMDVLRLIRAGRGVEAPEELRQICRLLWTRSPADQELFDQEFARYMEGPLSLASEPFLPEEDEADEAPDMNDGPQPHTLPGMHKDDQSPEENKEAETGNGQKTGTQVEAVSTRFDPAILATGEIHSVFQMTPRLPIGARDMAAAWRQLRRINRTGPAVELDVDGTIHDISQTGLFLKPRLRPRRRNQVSLLLLVDSRGSMSPFSLLTRAIIVSIHRSGLLNNLQVFYFKNYPEEYLFEDPSLVKARKLESVLMEYAQGSSTLILSDAGAARGYYREERLEGTRAFLKTLHAYTYLYAWINPMPAQRWQSSTAGEIARLVPMYPINWDGLNDAVNILRGLPFPPGVQLDD